MCSFLGQVGYTENDYEHHQIGNLAAQPAVMQRPQHGNVLPLLRCSRAFEKTHGDASCLSTQEKPEAQTTLLLIFDKSPGRQRPTKKFHLA